MNEPRFHGAAHSLTLRAIAELASASLPEAADPERTITGIAALDFASPSDLAFFDNSRYAHQLADTRAGICLTSARHAASVPAGTIALIAREPYRAFVAAASVLYPESLRPASTVCGEGISPAAQVSPGAVIEAGVVIDPCAVIGPDAEIGTGTLVGAGAVVGAGVRIGRNCAIGAGSTITNALIGDRVIIHPGVRIGQDGFGYVMGLRGHRKAPQVGRVIIQDDVEIGANSTIDRGANRDTMIGEGTKIDNLVQIGHNAVIGRHCVIVSQTGLSGSTTLGDFVVLGARVGTNNHVTIGDGAQIAAISIVNDDVPPGARWGGTPAKPVRQWFREMKLLDKMARAGKPSDDDEDKTKE